MRMPIELVFGRAAPCLIAVIGLGALFFIGFSLVRWLTLKISETPVDKELDDKATSAICPYKGCDAQCGPMDRFCGRCGRALGANQSVKRE